MSTAQKFERQMNLLAALCDTTRPLRWAEIREMIPGYDARPDAARKTFELDKRALLELGVPLQTVTGHLAEETGYIVDRARYELPLIEFEPDELAALHLALQTLQAGITDGDITRALWRLGGVVDAAVPSESIATLVGEVHEIPTDPALVPLFRAVADRRVVSFSYEAASGEAGRRSVEPWRLGFERGRWYLRGHDLERGEPRNFRLDRIRGEIDLREPGSATATPETSRPEPADPWEYGEGEPVIASLRIDAVVTPVVAPLLGSAPVATAPDGSTTWDVPVTNWPAFRSFVLSQLDRAEILGPPELREQMIDWLEAIERGEADDV